MPILPIRFHGVGEGKVTSIFNTLFLYISYTNLNLLKNPQRAFLRRGSKAVGPMSYIYGM